MEYGHAGGIPWGDGIQVGVRYVYIVIYCTVPAMLIRVIVETPTTAEW